MAVKRNFVYGKTESEQKILGILRRANKELINERLRSAVKTGAEIVKDEAMRRAPVGIRPPRRGVKTGRLKRSIKVWSGINDSMYKRHSFVSVEAWYPEDAIRYKKAAKHRAAGALEYYAFAPEYGIKKMTARPYLNPALKSKRRAYNALIRKTMEDYANEIMQALRRN